jgi:hypothetical protein
MNFILLKISSIFNLEKNKQQNVINTVVYFIT